MTSVGKMATASESPLVLVTGASGYIATHVIKQLQEEGYRVRGTVRSLQDEDKIKHLHNLCPESQFKLEIVEADLGKPESWEPAVKDAVYVIHVASPFPSTAPKDEKEVLQPAIDGTQSVLKACVAAKSVKRVVLTSSVAAISMPSTAVDSKVFNEDDWSDPNKLDAYAKSKTLAEKAAWDYVKELPDEDKIELAVVNPAYVMGPVLHGTQCTSMEVVKRLLEKTIPFIPKLNFPIVDVRDVATAHIKAMVIPEAADKRVIIHNTEMWMKEMAQILAKEFKSQGYNVPTMQCPYFALCLTSLFDKTIKLILPQVNKVAKFDNARMKEMFGITPRDVRETLIDMAYSLIEAGFVKKTKKYRGPHSQETPEAEEAKQEGEKEEKTEDLEKKPKENGDIEESKEEIKEDEKPLEKIEKIEEKEKVEVEEKEEVKVESEDKVAPEADQKPSEEQEAEK